jgi:acetoin utilization protein AcuB
MTRSPHTIAIGGTLQDAHAMMRQYGIRHLPVLEHGRLVGIVSERDLHLVETLKDVDPAKVKVEEAMSQDVLVTTPGAPISRIASQMAKRKVGSAVVVAKGEVLGIFSTVDALRALSAMTAPEKHARQVHSAPEAQPGA